MSEMLCTVSCNDVDVGPSFSFSVIVVSGLRVALGTRQGTFGGDLFPCGCVLVALGDVAKGEVKALFFVLASKGGDNEDAGELKACTIFVLLVSRAVV